MYIHICYILYSLSNMTLILRSSISVIQSDHLAGHTDHETLQ